MSILALAGPTACGKSPLAVLLAEQINGEIISVDSGAVYRQMDIGTAKPSAAIRAGVLHHLIDIVNPDEHYHVARFCGDAVAAVAACEKRGKTPILVGGTMMYFNALRHGLSAVPPVSAAVAAAVHSEMERDGLAAAYKTLTLVDAETAATLAANDKQRIQRALAVVRGTGVGLSQWRRQGRSPFLALRLIALVPSDRRLLRQQISQRLQAMWAAGLENETQQLIATWRLSADAPPLRMVGYRQAAARLGGLLSDAEMKEKAYYATCQLAKRQLTWLRQWHPTVTIEPFATTVSEQVDAVINRCVDKN